MQHQPNQDQNGHQSNNSEVNPQATNEATLCQLVQMSNSPRTPFDAPESCATKGTDNNISSTRIPISKSTIHRFDQKLSLRIRRTSDVSHGFTSYSHSLCYDPEERKEPYHSSSLCGQFTSDGLVSLRRTSSCSTLISNNRSDQSNQSSLPTEPTSPGRCN
jgi:hypothetical protein